MLQNLIDTFEELKKYVFIIDRGSKGNIVIKFNNDNFYHLVGLHKTNIHLFFPSYIKSMDKRYKYLKKNVNKFNNILTNQISEKDTLESRIKTFPFLLKLLKDCDNPILYNLKQKTPGSLYEGDFGLLKIYEQIYCLFCLKSENKVDNIIYCAPQSWMASNRINRLIEGKKPIYMEKIYAVPLALYSDDFFQMYT